MATTAAAAGSEAPRVHRLVRLFGASIGRKLVAAATGAALLVFLFGHLFGNLKVFQGQDALNSYAAWLQGHPLLWVARVGLLVVFVTHVYTTVTLAIENRRARPVRYEEYRPTKSSFASRYMLLSGLVVLAFVVYHLLHFTFGVIDSANTRLLDPTGRLDVYASVVRSFHNAWIAWSYVVAIGLLGLHLAHGITSAFQTAGVHHESYNKIVKATAAVVIGILVLGNWSIPLLILAGKVPLAGGM
ncbi:MAG: succinate dehydrogenase cytochrome b subunit [Gemmatimonadota bacterium]|nr:succinate dehydrogenase cytochrome b subunit [Gemmatimonadota bacterium]